MGASACAVRIIYGVTTRSATRLRGFAGHRSVAAWWVELRSQETLWNCGGEAERSPRSVKR